MNKTVSIRKPVLNHIKKLVNKKKRENHFAPSVKHVLEKIIEENYKNISI
jgi:hypothetical protein